MALDPPGGLARAPTLKELQGAQLNAAYAINRSREETVHSTNAHATFAAQQRVPNRPQIGW
nr:P6 [Botryosphaeria dothidea botrexvirus 1]